MQIAVRPHLKTGLAVVGASALAITPIAVAPPEIKLPVQAAVTSAAVALKASPIDFYTEVFERTLSNTEALADIFLSSPVPILQAVLENQFANVEALVEAVSNAADGLVTALTEQVPEELQAAFEALADGDVETALNTLLAVPVGLALPLLEVLGAVITPITTALNNFNAVVQDVLAAAILGGALAFAGPVLSGIGAVGTAVQGVIDAVGSGDIGAIADALINIPGVIADGVLNGGYGPLLLGALPAPGLLTAEGLLGPLGAGPIGFLLGLRQAIADIIAPQQGLGLMSQESDAGASQAANSVPSEDATFYNVSTTDAGSSDGATEDTEAAEGAEGAGAEGEGSGGAAGSGDENGAGAGGDEGDEGEEDGDLGDLGDLGDDGEEGKDGSTANGGTDLSGGNRAEPGQAGGSDANTGGGDGDDDTTSTTPSDDAGNGGGAGEGSGGGAGGDAGGDGSSDGGSDE